MPAQQSQNNIDPIIRNALLRLAGFSATYFIDSSGITEIFACADEMPDAN